MLGFIVRTIKGWEIPDYLEETKKITETVLAICLECDMKFSLEESVFWSLSKSVGLHKGGIGHKKWLFLRFK
jgi:hypothetical protein